MAHTRRYAFRVDETRRNDADPLTDLLETLVERAALRVAEIQGELEPASPWLTRTKAADYLDVPVSRLEKDKTVPASKWDGRVFYNREELDRWLLAMSA